MKIPKEELLHSLPPEWPEDLMPEIRAQVEQARRKVVVLDDDPTGTQTVHQVDVLTRWEPEDLLAAFEKPEPVVYILTNSRSFPVVEAEAMNEEIYTRLAQAREKAGRDFVIASRSDSTLRGHFPEEVYALASDTGRPFDGILLAPFFLEGGRYTIGDIHYVAEGDTLVPAAETEYAHDAVFGYHSSDLKAWVSEKSGGRIQPEQVASISIEELRLNGPQAAQRRLLKLEGGQVCVVNAASYRDLEVLVAGLLDAEAAGKRLIYRTAASFVRVRGGLSPRGLLTAPELATLTGSGTGLVVAGSYIQKSSQQIEALQVLPGVLSIEVHVEDLLDEDRRGDEVRRVAAAGEAAMRAGQDVLVFTSRRLITEGATRPSLSTGQIISSGLVEIVQTLQTRPAWVIAKGGITSSDIATGGLGVQCARVLGQVLPGVPVWLTGPESRWPGLLYVVFPGNVGSPEGIAEAVKILKGGWGKDDRGALLLLARLGLELRGELDEEASELVLDEDNALRIVTAVSGQVAHDLNQAEPVVNLPDELLANAAAREILRDLALDDSLRPRLDALVAHPPRHGPVTDSPVKAYPIILETVAAWLLTRLSIEEDEQGEFQVDLDGRKASLAVIEAVVKATLTCANTDQQQDCPER